MNKSYVVCDVETTGGTLNQNRIIEIALIRIENQKITETFHSLVHPGKHIPPFITNLTGISNEMIKDAPYFHEIAFDVLNFFKESIFVAHNATFDYKVIQSEFARMGINFEIPIIDTLRLSREFFPDLPSYQLKKLTSWLDIPLHDHHRALSDAMATANLFLKILSLQDYSLCDNFNSFSYLPDTPGLFFLLDKDKNVLLVKSSENIRKSVQQQYRSFYSRNKSLQQSFEDVSYIETQSLLIANLLEWVETQKVKAHLRRKHGFLKKIGIYHQVNDEGYICFEIHPTSKKKNELPLIHFDTIEEAKKELYAWCLTNELYENLCGLNNKNLHCEYQLYHNTYNHKEPPDIYNQRVENLIFSQLFEKKTFLIIDNQNSNATPFVFIKNGLFQGYGYFPSDFTLTSIDEIYLFLKIIPLPPLELTKFLKLILNSPKINKTTIRLIKL
ncbi:MAG: exonuclease domain-containing protein [Bacteroidales bacterium]|nr:exonuclease domain-containing protein [Bacteroidales bacterium]